MRHHLTGGLTGVGFGAVVGAPVATVCGVVGIAAGVALGALAWLASAEWSRQSQLRLEARRAERERVERIRRWAAGASPRRRGPSLPTGPVWRS